MPLLNSPRIVIVNSAGQPYALARMYTYRATTLTPLTVYTTASYGVAHSNPVEADANGVFDPIYIDPSLGYDLRIIIKDQNDVALTGYDIDNIPRADNVFPASTFTGNVSVTGNVTASANIRANGLLEVYGANPRIVLNETDRGSDGKFWDIDVSAGVLSLRTRTDADGAGKNAIVITRSGTAITSIELGSATDNPTITINGRPYISNDIFTATLTGMTTTVTGTVAYKKVGRLATLYVFGGDITGASNTTAMTMTGVPAAVTALDRQRVPCFGISDNGNTIAGIADIDGAIITFYPYNTNGVANYVSASATGFTNSGTKGLLDGWSITYAVADT